MRFDYLFICHHSNGTIYANVYSTVLIRNSYQLKAFIKSIEKDMNLTGITILQYKLTSFNPFISYPPTEKSAFIHKKIMDAWFFDKSFSNNFVSLLTFLCWFPKESYPTAFIGILFSWLFIWVFVKILMKGSV